MRRPWVARSETQNRRAASYQDAALPTNLPFYMLPRSFHFANNCLRSIVIRRLTEPS
jgi:hypothetical protein